MNQRQPLRANSRIHGEKGCRLPGYQSDKHRVICVVCAEGKVASSSRSRLSRGGQGQLSLGQMGNGSLWVHRLTTGSAPVPPMPSAARGAAGSHHVKKDRWLLAGWLRWLEGRPVHHEVVGSILRQGTDGRCLSHIHVPLSVSLPLLSPSKNKNQ